MIRFNGFIPSITDYCQKMTGSLCEVIEILKPQNRRMRNVECKRRLNQGNSNRAACIKLLLYFELRGFIFFGLKASIIIIILLSNIPSHSQTTPLRQALQEVETKYQVAFAYDDALVQGIETQRPSLDKSLEAWVTVDREEV